MEKIQKNGREQTAGEQTKLCSPEEKENYPEDVFFFIPYAFFVTQDI